ncbi:MAG: hypothetical protein IB617_02445 [Candidatus Nealsonbacteria bacterium]|nr:MAG: hypothetical protein IB617_02445 [Candidatus Nealsonbacteria bacterium]
MVERFNVEAAKKLLKDKLGSLYKRVEEILDSYGEGLLFDVINVLMHATDQDEEKIKEVLDLLEQHKEYLDSLKKRYNRDPEYQHPDIGGRHHEIVGFSKTQEMFSDIYKRVLGLKLRKEQEIPNGSFIVKTRNSVYRFGKDEEGERNVSRDRKPLDFSRCKITKLIIGDEMVLERLDDSGLELATTPVLSIETS